MSNKKNNQVTLGIKIRSTITWIVLGGLIPLYNLAGVLLFFLSRKAKHRMLTSWGNVFTFLGKHWCNVDYEVIGIEHLIKEPAILASNHQSTWETMAFNVFLPQHVWILKRELIYLPFFGWALRMVSPIAINRSDRVASVQQILSQSKERIKDGFSIMVFPEGTRVAPGVDQPYKTGVARMALQLNIPIVPIAHNAGHIMPRRSFWIYPGKVTIRIGKPMYPSKDDNAESLTEKVKSAIIKELKIMGEV
jgi:1-acyl-sn-glycerol-3-phosphate acyltransferase